MQGRGKERKYRKKGCEKRSHHKKTNFMKDIKECMEENT